MTKVSFFVTVCTPDKQKIFGHVQNGSIYLNELGKKVNDCIQSIPSHHPDVEIHNHIVMPNHVHILLQLVGTRYIASNPDGISAPQNCGCLKPPKHGKPKSDNHHNTRLGVVIGTFKSAVTRYARTRYIASLPHDASTPRGIPNPHVLTRYIASAPGWQLWQQRFHEHEVRDKHAYDNINRYITENPARWDHDCFNKTT